MGQPQSIGSRSFIAENHWQGRIIDPDVKFDPHSDPRSAVAPAVRDRFGDVSELQTRGFIEDRICACWNLTSVSLFFSLMTSNRTYHRDLLFRPAFTSLSIPNCTVLWRVAQKFSLEEASNELGKAFKKAYANYDRKKDQIEEKSRIEDEAFRILARCLDFTKNTTTAPSITLQRQLDATAAPHNVNDIGSAVARVPEPTKDTLRSLTVKSVFNEFSSTEATNHLAQLVAGVEEAISRRDKFIVDQLHKEDAKINKELYGLLVEKTRHEKAGKVRLGIKRLGSCIDALHDDDEPLLLHSGARRALNALEEEIKKLPTKRSRDYESESAALRGKQKRIKTQVELLAQTERTFSASEHLKVY
ncbi:unnamed protein product [Clonostachys solani]|uniref:Uncharacterized protein n=1 Tax=Clonostachys solani TaxID=160281 RepID=A0A9P0EMB6_9HYPO|nr:unnamed protein product [Clonostachys solani]